MDPVSGIVVGGKYRLERPLARGGMGSVWVGRHLDLDSPVAVKFMDVSTDKGALASRTRFEREAKAAASIRSSHIVQVLDYDATSDAPFIVMELLEGEDLGQRLTKWGRLELGEVASIVMQLSRGLVLAHEAGIVHRDLKPSNVFIARVGVEEVVKILDFGVAKEIRLDVDHTETTTGLVVGSPSYMSPEQARGGRVDARSDLWSVGVLIFQALTGKRPFEGANLGDVLVRICSDQLPVATKLAPQLPPAIDEFFERALSRSPDGRFQDAWALADALAAIAGTTDESSSGVMRRAAVPSEPRTSDPGGSSKSRALGKSNGWLKPRDEATGSLISQSDPTVEAAINRDGTLRMPVDAPHDALTVKAPAVPVGTGTAMTNVASIPVEVEKPPSRRGYLWGIGGAAIVAIVWVMSQVGVFGAGAKANATANEGRVEATVATTATPISTATATATSTATATATPTPTATPTSTSSSTSTSRGPLGHPPSWSHPAGPGVDPKFGLPTDHTH